MSFETYDSKESYVTRENKNNKDQIKIYRCIQNQ